MEHWEPGGDGMLTVHGAALLELLAACLLAPVATGAGAAPVAASPWAHPVRLAASILAGICLGAAAGILPALR